MYKSINALKGIAAFLVAFGHFYYWTGKGNVFPSSFILAVDFFFIASGFTLVNAIYNKKISEKEYIKYIVTARITRLFIPYFLLSCCYILVWALLKRPLDAYTIIMSLLLGQSLGFSFGEPIISNTVIGIAWCLSAEFYLSIVLCPLVYKFKAHIIKIIYISSIICFLSFHIIINFSPDFMNVNYYRIQLGGGSIPMGFFRATLGYSLGVLCFYIRAALKERYPATIKSFATLGEVFSILIIVVLFGSNHYVRINEYIFPFIASLCIILFSFQKGMVSKILCNKYIYMVIGEIYFSIYLIHPIVIELCNYIEAPLVLFFLILMIASVAFKHTFEQIGIYMKKRMTSHL